LRIRTARDSWVCRLARGQTLDVGSAKGSVSRLPPAVTAYTSLDYPQTAQTLYGARPQVFGDARCLPISSDSCDTVLLLDVIEHIDDPYPALIESARVLRPGGQLLLAVPFAYPLHDVPFDYQRLTEFGLRRLIARSGLEVEDVVEAGSGIAAACLSLALALAQAAIDGLVKRSWSAVLSPILVALVPLVNLFGWAGGGLLPSPRFFPGAYFVIARKRGAT
jgi:SAM-dependent methyltransferase